MGRERQQNGSVAGGYLGCLVAAPRGGVVSEAGLQRGL